MSRQLSLEKNSFLEVENSISDAFWLFEMVSSKNQGSLPTFSTKLDCFPVYSPCWKSRGGHFYLCALQMPEYSLWPGDVCSCFAGMAFSGSSNVPLQTCWNVSSLLGLLQCNFASLATLLGKQLGNVGFIQMCQIEYWICKVCKCLLLNSSGSHRIWFCSQGRATSPSLLRLSMENFMSLHNMNQKMVVHTRSNCGPLI